MCGVVGVVAHSPVNLALYNALRVLQHRGQDAAGIVTLDGDHFCQRKANGLVSEVFQQRHMMRLKGNLGIGHTRYPTAGSSSAAEAQPFYVNSPFGIALAHNGNLINAPELRALCARARRHINTDSDSELLLNILAWQLDEQCGAAPDSAQIFKAVRGVMALIRGAYAVVALVHGVGVIAFRDPYGIRPLCLGEKPAADGQVSRMVASESVALDICNYHLVRDIAPGEALLLTPEGGIYREQCAAHTSLRPCIFEYVYFARPDTVMNGASVYATRVRMGTKLAARIKREHPELKIDAVIPIPDTSVDVAVQIARQLNVPYRQGFVKNRYVGRTFIMPGQKERKQSVRHKLNPIPAEFAGKRVLLVDDSIVRGTTSLQIVEMARESGAAEVYFASAAPAITHPNIYGIDMPSAEELIASGRSVTEIARAIRADALIYQELADLEDAVREENPQLTEFETSIFTGDYPVPPEADYFVNLASQRSDDAKAERAWKESAAEELAIYNIHGET